MIGTAARRAGTKVATIRFYEQVGLLAAAPRTASGRRTYGEAELRRLSFIRHARPLGFSLEDIRAMLELEDRPGRPCAEADRIARAQLVEIENKIERLIRLRGELRRIVETCGGGNAADCRVIAALADRSLCADAHAGHRDNREA